jgi:hypothetical protein
VLCSSFKMDQEHSRICPFCETIDIHRVLRTHEDFIIKNENLIFYITSRMNSQEETRNNENAFILGTLHIQKRKI